MVHLKRSREGALPYRKKFFNEFKEFITRGNVLGYGYRRIVATAFGKITTSLVGDVFMPLIGYLFGGIDLSALNITPAPPRCAG